MEKPQLSQEDPHRRLKEIAESLLLSPGACLSTTDGRLRLELSPDVPPGVCGVFMCVIIATYDGCICIYVLCIYGVN